MTLFGCFCEILFGKNIQKVAFSKSRSGSGFLKVFAKFYLAKMLKK
jgi:hypothetical protein